MLCHPVLGKYGIVHYFLLGNELFRDKMQVWIFKLLVDDLNVKFSESIKLINMFRKPAKSSIPLTIIGGGSFFLIFCVSLEASMFMSFICASFSFSAKLC